MVQGNDHAPKPLEITVAIKNKETQKWETPCLNERENLDIERAIEAIRLLGTQAGLGVWNVFDKDGTILEMSHEGVFVKEGQQWRDLLDDQTVEPIRGRVRRTLTAVTGILGKKENREGASGEVALNAEELNQGDVIIQVKVVSQPTPLQRQVTEELKGALDKERAFNLKVAEALIAFDNPVFSEDFLSRGWSEEEIKTHSEALKALKVQSDQTLKIFEEALLKLSTGKIKEGMDYLCASMQQHYPAYISACCGLVIPQKVAKGRCLIEPRLPFMVDLEQGLNHVDILGTLFSEIQGGADAGLKKAAQEGTWPEVLKGMQAELEKLQAELTFTPMVASLNYNHQLNQEFAKRMRTFVETFQGNREQLDEAMREQGITPLESAYIFNHYVPFSDVLTQWNERVQTVVDLANLIRPFKQALRGITLETDLTKKEDLQEEFQKLVEAQLPVLKGLQKELTRLGGLDQFRTVLAATQEFREALELNSPKRKGAAQKLQAEAQSQVQLMEDRLVFITQIFHGIPES